MSRAPNNDASERRLQGLGLLLERLLHDLKQPLNQMRVVAQDVRLDVKKNRLDVDSLPEAMREIEDAVDRLARRLDQLRAFVAPPAGELALEPHDLTELCGACVTHFREQNPGLSIEEHYESGLTVRLSERAYFEQALRELLQNSAQAVQAEQRVPALVELSTAHRGETITVSIRDNGGGASQHGDRVFEPFFTTRPGATGLGLALARALVRHVGGSVRIARADDAGTEFELCFGAGG